MLMLLDEKNPVIDFSASDRCDRCGAQAYLYASKEDGFSLLLCGHHAKDHHDRLLDEGWTVVVDTEGYQSLVPGSLYDSPV
jgi:hypothetical protein